MAEDGKRKNLGRGLDALFGEDADHLPSQGPSGTAPAAAVRRDGLTAAPIEDLQPGVYQPRRNFEQEELDELATSLKTHGIIQPILVRRSEVGPAAYEIIAGERRWRAAQLAQLHEVPILVKDFTDSEALEIALVENLQRENLSTLEEAEGYHRLMEEFLHTQEELADLLGKSRSHLANTMRLLNLPDAVKAMLNAGQLSAGHARALLNADDPVALAKEVINKSLNVRQTEKLVKKGEAPKASKPTGRDKGADTLALEKELAATLGLNVSIDFKGPGGKVIISYKTLEQLDDILRRLKAGPEGARNPATESAFGVPSNADVFPDTLNGVENDIGLSGDVDDVIAELEAGAAINDDEPEDSG